MKDNIGLFGVRICSYLRKVGGHKFLSKTKKFFLIEVQLIYSVVLISAVQQSDSFIHIYILILKQNLINLSNSHLF